jgi:hypothetical protein
MAHQAADSERIIGYLGAHHVTELSDNPLPYPLTDLLPATA